jgi:hypothetical protein
MRIREPMEIMKIKEENLRINEMYIQVGDLDLPLTQIM